MQSARCSFGVHKDRILDTVDAKRVVITGLLVTPKRPSTSSFTQYPDKGAIAYDEATNTIMFSDGVTWHDLGAGTVTSITATTPIVVTPSPITTTGVISLATSGVTPGTYTNATITVDQFGLITMASNGSAGGTVTSITATSPVIVTPSPITTTGVISLATVTSAGSYSLPNITVDSFGRVTAASSATLTAGSGITITPTGSPPTNYTIASTATVPIDTLFWNSGIITSSTGNSGFIGWNNTVDNTFSCVTVMARAGTLQNLTSTLMNADLATGQNINITLIHNEGTTLMSTLFVGPLVVPAFLVDSTHTITVAVGDRVTVQYSYAGSSPTASNQIVAVSVQLV